MPLQYRTFSLLDFGNGVDQHSPENRIQEGYLETLLNADPQDSGYVKKRKGYQRHLSNLPVRVKNFEDDGAGTICFTLAEGVNVSELPSTPIVVQGTVTSATPGSSGDFPAGQPSVQYYSSFTTDVRKTFSTGTNTLSITNDETNLDMSTAFIGVATSDSTINLTNTLIDVDSISINKTTYEVQVDYTNSSPSSFEGFVYYAAQPANSGTTFINTYSASLPASSTTTINIPQSTHGLNSNFIVVRNYLDDGTTLTEMQPDSFVIDESTGDITLEITNNSLSPITDDVVTILTAVSSSNRVTSDLPSGGQKTITISNFTDSFIFPSIYLQDVGAGTLELVEFDDISVDTATDTVTFTFTNNSGSPTNFEIYWVPGYVTSNRICVSSNSTNGTVTKTTEATLSIWGLDHETLYDGNGLREGWVTHLDTYRSTATSKLVAGLGGVLHEELFYADGASTNSSYSLSLAYPRLRARVDTTAYVGPTFASGSANRTRGYILGTNLVEGFAEITTISYNDITGYVDYELSIESIDDSAYVSGTTISTTAGLEDYFTAQQTGHSFFNGEFKIKAVDDSSLASGTLIISVENSSVTTGDFDETDVGGQGGIFTDRIDLSADSPFLTGDRLVASEIFPEEDLIAVKSPSNVASADKLVVGSIVTEVEVPAGLRIVGTRENTEIVPLRTLTDSPTVETFVAGDMLNYSPVARKLRIKAVNVLDDVVLSIDGDGDVATATMASEDTSSFFVGQKLLLLRAGDFSGVVEITSITGINTFTFASTVVASGNAGILTGKTVEIDENLTVTDSTDNDIFYNNYGRWIPIEAPSDNYDTTPSNYFTYLDRNGSTAQPFLRSTMVNDNLYLTNGDDEVMKYDGVNLYRAGLPRWQPQLFVTTTTSGGVIDVSDVRSVAISAIATNRMSITASPTTSAVEFSVGDRVSMVESGQPRQDLVVGSVDSTNGVIYFTGKINSGFTTSADVKARATFRYYFRLNAIDRNNNVVATAATGINDYEVTLTENAGVNLRLVGMPSWGPYDYDRIEVETYRTRAGEAAPFFRISVNQLDFGNKRGYVDVLDALSDSDLRDFDEVNTALLGTEVGTQWSEPLRAKYVTSDGNRLILGNLRSYPKLDFRFFEGVTNSFNTGLIDKKFLFKKDGSDALTTSNGVDRIGYEFTNTTTRTIQAATYDAYTGQLIVTTTATLPVGVAEGDWVYLYHSSEKAAATNVICGWAQVKNVQTTTEFDLAMDIEQAITFNSSTHADKILFASTSGYVPILAATDYNFENEPEYTELTAMRRFSAAINTSMRMMDYDITGQEDFTPWLSAGAGGEFEVGQLLVTQPVSLSTVSSVVLPSFGSGQFRLFINNDRADSTDEVDVVTNIYPSRVVGSYPNYPEIFDNPESKLDSESSSAISVNSSDGQQLTGLIPFFGSSAFGAAQKSSVVVAFKENSIYLLDYNQKAAGSVQSLQKLESRGLGCKYPYSIAHSQYGIMFATTGGIYKLNRNMQVTYAGEKLERIWKQQLNLSSDVTVYHATQFAVENQYKLSVVPTGGTVPSEVLVYDHTREGSSGPFGSWTVYDSHRAIGWANLGDSSYFAGTDGRVYVLRDAGDDSDFRDDDQAISMDVLFRMWDLGDSAIRKAFRSVRLHFRTVADMAGTTLLTAIDSSNSFDENLPFSLTGNEQSDSLSDVNRERISSIKFRINRRKGTYLQLRLQNNSIDEPVELTHVDVKAAPLRYRGTREASDTTE